jgi:hypothetical protein
VGDYELGAVLARELDGDRRCLVAAFRAVHGEHDCVEHQISVAVLSFAARRHPGASHDLRIGTTGLGGRTVRALDHRLGEDALAVGPQRGGDSVGGPDPPSGRPREEVAVKEDLLLEDPCGLGFASRPRLEPDDDSRWPDGARAPRSARGDRPGALDRLKLGPPLRSRRPSV